MAVSQMGAKQISKQMLKTVEAALLHAKVEPHVLSGNVDSLLI
jgi:hypothetical protein